MWYMTYEIDRRAVVPAPPAAVWADIVDGSSWPSWSPLGRSRVLADPTIGRIAAGHGVTPAQAIIRWHLQTGGALVPKSTHPHRLRENLDVEGFTLSDADMAAIATLETGERTGTHPDDRN